MAIKSWGNSSTRRLFEKGRSAWPGLDVEKALNRLATINVASRLDQIGVLKSVGLHPLKGNRKRPVGGQRQWSVACVLSLQRWARA